MMSAAVWADFHYSSFVHIFINSFSIGLTFELTNINASTAASPIVGRNFKIELRKLRKSTLRKFGFIPERLKFAGFMLIFFGFIFLYFEFTKPQIHSDKDLYFINGHFENYNFINGSKGSRDYTFKIQEYANTFKIKADFLGDHFNIEKFIKLQKGDYLMISIFLGDKKKLNRSKYLFVYSISDNKTEILNLNFSLEKHNDYLLYYAFTFFLLSGFGTLYFDKKVKNWQE